MNYICTIEFPSGPKIQVIILNFILENFRLQFDFNSTEETQESDFLKTVTVTIINYCHPPKDITRA